MQTAAQTHEAHKHIVYVIRYSILQRAKAWRIAKQHDFETYRNKLFNSERLRLKRALFERVTLPSLACQGALPERCSRTILILVSPVLPQEERLMLEKLAREFDEIKLLDISESERVPSKVADYLCGALAKNGEHIVTTVRLDDDDALVANFEALLTPYMAPEYFGKAITFAKGFELLVNASTLSAIEAQHLTLPKIALGLSYIAHIADGQVTTPYSNIYQLGSHDEVDKQSAIIKDTAQHSYIRVAYAEQDTEAEGFFRRRDRGAKPVKLDELHRLFPAVNLLW